MTTDFLKLGIIFLTAAVTIVPLCKKLGLGSVLGYLAAGSLIGPWGLKFFSDSESIIHFAEFGVVILLFLIGLELKPARLWVMRKAVFGMGTAQVFLTSLVIFPITFFLGLSLLSSVIVSFSFSLSSTAFAVQLMSEKNQLNTQFGRSSFAILLFQDIFAIPFLAIIPIMAMGSIHIDRQTCITIGSIVAMILGIILGGKLILRPLFRIAASTRTREIFTAASLLVILFVSYLMNLFHLSMALGSFIAGLLLSDSEYRHQIEVDLEPFKGLLLGLFFMGVGMSVDYGIISTQPLFVLAGLLIVFSVKFFVMYGIGRFSKHGNVASQNMAITLSQGGEFAFVLLGVALQYKLIDSTTNDLSTILITLSMVLSSLASTSVEKIRQLLHKKPEDFDEITDEQSQVIVAGFGRVGQVAGRLLRVLDIPFTALELDSEQVDVIRRFGNKIYYGDASRIDLLQAAGTEHAKVFFLAVDDVDESVKIAEIVKENFPNIKIIARARNRGHVYRLRDAGVTHIWRETWFSSLEMGKDMLTTLGMTEDKANSILKTFTENDYKLLDDQYKVYNDEKSLIDQSRAATQQLTELLREDQKQQK